MSRLTTVLFLALLAAALVAWLATVATTLSLHQSDHAGNGLSYSFANIGVVITWMLLAIVLFMSFGRIQAPSWVPLLAFTALIASAGAGITVVNLLNDNGQFPAQWPIVTLIVAPLLMMAFALWASFPSIQRLMDARTVYPGVWAIVLALSVVPFPLRSTQKRQLAQQQEAYVADQAAKTRDEQSKEDAQLAALNDSSHLRDFLALVTVSTEMRAAVLLRIQSLPNRQKDVLEMLGANEGVAMGELRNLSLELTPELCTSAVEFLRKHAIGYRAKFNNDNNRFAVAEQELEKYVFGMQWMAERHCDVRSAILAYRETALAYPTSPERELYIKRLENIQLTSGG